jgi:HK97 gp10 family phage protein
MSLTFNIKDNSKEVTNRVEAAAERALDETAKWGVAEMKKRVPVDTGDLRDSMMSTKKKIGKDTIRIQLGSSRKTPLKHGFFAHLYEYGSEKTKKTPFRAPVFKDIVEEYEKNFEKEKGSIE